MDDNKSDDFSEMSEEDIEYFKKDTEEKFFKMLNSGEDIRLFLFFPYEFISDAVKKHLDDFLLLEAYDNLDRDTNQFTEDFLVYKDPIISISLHDDHEKIEILDKMIQYFVEKEDYEKCAKITKVINLIKNKHE